MILLEIGQDRGDHLSKKAAGQPYKLDKSALLLNYALKFLDADFFDA